MKYFKKLVIFLEEYSQKMFCKNMCNDITIKTLISLLANFLLFLRPARSFRNFRQKTKFARQAQHWISRTKEVKFYLRISQLSINIIVPSLHFASLNTLLSRRISHFPRITNIPREIMEYAAYLSIGSRSFDQRDAHISSPGMSITATSFAPSASRPFMIDEPDPVTSTDYTTALTCGR